ncbi:hypothetical protein [Bacillus wiedmannii]|uniref:hypothetical protein n=1 Tax=Bacillus wiedmannii TaxID=1890302 RepID=UPI00103B943E|nr:hypothetical protein [Bacillus wiedmannii]TCD28060.1 hypothetical protein E0D84_27810 [Bacillus wiedmannii]
MTDLDRISNDIKTVVLNKETADLGLKELIVSLKDYAGSLKTAQEIGQLLLLIGAIMECERDEFEEAIFRLSEVMEEGEKMNKITEEQYKIAESNGINRLKLQQRVHRYGENLEEAIKRPIRKMTFYPNDITELRKKNGISPSTYYMRIKNGMNPKEAATIPPMLSKKRHGCPSYVTHEEWNIAKSNGVNTNNLYQRIIVMKWEVEKAINTPIKKKV